MQAPSQDTGLAGRREWIGLCVLSIACLIYSMDLSILFLATPAIVADLDPSASELLWINDIYGFMVAGFLVTMGTLGDRIGRRRVLLIGAFAFGVASALAATSAAEPAPGASSGGAGTPPPTTDETAAMVEAAVQRQVEPLLERIEQMETKSAAPVNPGAVDSS